MEITKGYKYFLTRNTRDGVGIKTIEILKLPENSSIGYAEEITYIRLPDGGFNVSRVLIKSEYFMDTSFREIDPIEFEVISRGVLDSVDICDRLFSYFDNNLGPMVDNLHGYYEREKVCKKLGIPRIEIDSSKTPGPLQTSIPYINDGFIMATDDCLRYLKAIKEDYPEDTELDKGNKTWMMQGLDYLIKIVDEKITNIGES